MRTSPTENGERQARPMECPDEQLYLRLPWLLRSLRQVYDRLFRATEKIESPEWTRQPLPKIRRSKWRRKKIVRHFLPPHIDSKKMQPFCRAWEEVVPLLNEARKIHPEPGGNQQADDLRKRGLVYEFLKKIWETLPDDLKQASDPSKHITIAEDINRVLLPFGFYINATWIERGDEPPLFTCVAYQGTITTGLTISHAGEKTDIPILEITSEEDWVHNFEALLVEIFNPQFSADFDGQYVGDLRCVLMQDHEGAAEAMLEKLDNSNQQFPEYRKSFNADPERAHELRKKMTLVHESMHVVLLEMHERVPIDPETIRRKGRVNMGAYHLDTDQIPDRLLSFRHLSELAALGFELQHAEDMAPTIAEEYLNGGARSEYELAQYIMQREVLHSPHLSTALKEEVTRAIEAMEAKALAEPTQGENEEDDEDDEDDETGEENTYPIWIKSAMIIPNETLHKMGERMAKLALYLGQGDTSGKASLVKD